MVAADGEDNVSNEAENQITFLILCRDDDPQSNPSSLNRAVDSVLTRRDSPREESMMSEVEANDHSRFSQGRPEYEHSAGTSVAVCSRCPEWCVTTSEQIKNI